MVVSNRFMVSVVSLAIAGTLGMLSLTACSNGGSSLEPSDSAVSSAVDIEKEIYLYGDAQYSFDELVKVVTEPTLVTKTTVYTDGSTEDSSVYVTFSSTADSVEQKLLGDTPTIVISREGSAAENGNATDSSMNVSEVNESEIETESNSSESSSAE